MQIRLPLLIAYTWTDYCHNKSTNKGNTTRFYFRFRSPVSGKENGNAVHRASDPHLLSSLRLGDLFSAAALLLCDHHKSVTLSLFLM